MTKDGKQLESLVAFVESTLLPQGFDVKTNERVYNDDGVQIAEFDIEIRGMVGSTTIAWLIECRDRPSDGPASGAWIEQLVGRRTRFGFNKVTAVSTTGFAPGAVEFAEREGVELREVEALEPDEFSTWLAIRHLQQIERRVELRHLTILVNQEKCNEEQRMFLESLLEGPAEGLFLKSLRTGELAKPQNAFLGAVDQQGTLFDDLLPNGPGKNIRMQVQYVNDQDHFIIETSAGPIRVEAILFEGELSIKETLVPLSVTSEYRRAKTGEAVSQLAAFSPQMDGATFSLEMHRMADSGATHIVLRKVADVE
jgi:Restriction endonuclease